MTEKGIAHQQMAVIPAQAGDLHTNITASADQKGHARDQLNEKKTLQKLTGLTPFTGWLAP